MLPFLRGCVKLQGYFTPTSEVSGDSSGPWLLVYICYSSIIQGPAFIVHHSAAPMLVPGTELTDETGSPGSTLKPPRYGMWPVTSGSCHTCRVLPGSKVKRHSIFGTHRPLPCPDPIMLPGSSFYSGGIFLLKTYSLSWSKPYRIKAWKPATYHTEARTQQCVAY